MEISTIVQLNWGHFIPLFMLNLKSCIGSHSTEMSHTEGFEKSFFFFNALIYCWYY